MLLAAVVVSNVTLQHAQYASAHPTTSKPTTKPRPTLATTNNANRGSSNYFPFADIASVIQKWDPSQHLYVQGNLGLSQAQLMGLETWLHNNGPHWTVILMEDASTQRYTNSQGRIETGMDAVELSISDLMEVGSFRSQLNPITGQQDAAVFILFLNQRKFSYRASEAQNQRGLGQDRWIGKLDRPAYRAMRGGGRVLDAVRDTVNAINQSLTLAINQEQKIAQQNRLQRQRETDQLRSRLAEVENKIARITKSAATIKQRKPDADSDLTQPDVQGWRNLIFDIQTALNNPSPELGPLKESTDRIDDQSDDWVDLFREYDRFETSEKQLNQRKQQLQIDAADHFDKLHDSMIPIEKMLTDARAAYGAADSKFKIHLNSATYALENATQELKGLRDAAATAKARKSFIQSALAAIGSAFTALFALLFWWLNRKRAPAKIRAVQKLQQRQQEVRQQLEGMGDLLKRADVVIGDREAIDRKGYQGKTRDLSSKALDDIDQILIMSSSVDRVIDEAKAKIEPTSLWTKIINQWSPENFNDGFDLLENKPIQFGENEGIALVKQRDASRSRGADFTTDQPAQNQAPQEISLSFSELFKIFRERSRSANETIGQVESGWTQIVSTNRDLQTAIDQAAAEEQQSREASESDGLLFVPQLFDELLSSAQADQTRAQTLGRSDPISAIEGPATTGLRKSANADQLAKQLNDVRRELIPSIRTHAQSLLQRGREVQWVDAAIDDFTDRAQALTSQALTNDVQTEIQQWRTSFDSFGAAVAKAVVLHDTSVNQIAPAISTATAHVEAAKKTIAGRLNLASDAALTEINSDGLRILKTASDHNAASRYALDRGDPIGAEASINQAVDLIGDVDEIRNRSLQILDSLLMDVQKLETQIQSSVHGLAETESTLRMLQDTFAKSSLMVQGARWVVRQTQDPDTGDSVQPAVVKDKNANTNVSASSNDHNHRDGYQTPPIRVSDLFLLASRQSEKANDASKNARQLYAAGRLLAAQESLIEAQLLVDAGQHNQKLIQDRAVQLQQSVEDNAGKLVLLQQKLSTLQKQSQAPAVMAPTHAMLASEEQNLIDLQQAIESESIRRDPFNESSAIESVDQDLQRLQDAIASDQRLFDEAERSVRSLDHAIAAAQGSIVRSRRDQIPDSQNIQQAVSSLQNAESSASTLRDRLKTPHEDWTEIDQSADRLLAEVTVSIAKLQSELDAAQRAAGEIQTTAASYQQALNWSGSFGIRANPATARTTLDHARAMLGRGDYQSAIQYARQANQSVVNAIAAAETEVMRQQAAQRRAAELRRRQSNQRVSTNRSILGSGIGRSSGNWNRPSSTGSRSGSGSGRGSGSTGRGGFSRSGW